MKNDKETELEFWLIGGGAVFLASITMFCWLFSLGPFDDGHEHKPSKVERTIKVLDESWDKWLDRKESE